MLLPLVMILYFNLISSLTFTFPSMICFSIAVGPSSPLCHIIRSKGWIQGAHSLVSSMAVQSARLELLFYVYLLLSCAGGTRNKCFLSSHIFLLPPSSLFGSLNGQKNKYCFDSRFPVIHRLGFIYNNHS